jgi:exopolysaccharide biosynthesis polyprenyl glycosylphosphotransferase
LRDLIAEHQIDEVWSTLPPHAYDKLYSVIVDLDEVPVRIKVIPDYFALALVKAKIEMIDGIPLIGLREPVIGDLDRLLKRVFDFGVGLILALLLLPLMLIIAVAIRLDSRGPALFRQERAGENGKPFLMLKFRTMTAEASSLSAEPPSETEKHKVRGDPRLTRMGASLRRLSLDELPQLLNVLVGDMSLVGPRPEVPWLVEKYAPWQRKRFAVPQGITGWWQINGRSDKPMHENTDDDLYYVYNYSLLLDIKILLRTPLVVIHGKGAF